MILIDIINSLFKKEEVKNKTIVGNMCIKKVDVKTDDYFDRIVKVTDEFVVIEDCFAGWKETIPREVFESDWVTL